MEHRVVSDFCGFNEAYFRLTCNTCEKTLVKQPHYTERGWAAARQAFLRAHPCDEVQRLPL